MTKIIQAFLCILLFGGTVYAQSYKIYGTLLDDKELPLPHVLVQIKHPWGAPYKTTLTDEKGAFIFENLGRGGFKLSISFLGFAPYEKEFIVRDSDIPFGLITLQTSSKLLNEITIKDTKAPGMVLNDTVQYSANSYKVAKDASAEDLIEKMPSVTKENGTIKAHNEDVKQILVDGKPFFGNDPNLSLKSLPAEIIDKVQIFDQLSEQSQFTGVNDGNTVKTINIVTKSGMNNGQFGKVYAGYGNDQRYQTGGNFNYFDGDRRISLIGMSNNINIQNFSIDDILGAMGGSGNRPRGGRPGGDMGRDFRGNSGPGDFLVSQSGGVAKTHALGFNYSDRYGSKLEWNLSYFLNYSENAISNELERHYFNTGNIDQLYTESTNSAPHNTNHRLNGRIEWKIDSFNSILIRPRITFQNNNNDIVNQTESLFNSVPANRAENDITSNSSGSNFSNNILFRHRFFKPGRTASIEYGLNSAPKDEDLSQNSFVSYLNPGNSQNDTLNQIESNRIEKTNWSLNFEYTEPINDKHSVLASYRYENKKEDTDIQTFEIPQDSSLSPILNTALSNQFQSQTNIHRFGPGYQLNINQKLNVSARLTWQAAYLNNTQYLPFSNSNSRGFYNFTPSLFLRYSVGRTKNLMVHYRTSTQLPTIEQLQNVLNNSNPVQLSIGNPNLKQSIQHQMSIRYNVTGSNSTLFYASVRFAITDNYITNHNYIRSRNNPIFSILDIPLGSQLSIPENTSASYSIRNFVSYSLPIPALKLIFSGDLSYNYSRTPGLLDDTKLVSNSNNLGIGVSVSSNINDKIDFNIQFRPSYNTYENSNSSDEYILYSGGVKFNWQFISRFIFRSQLNYSINESLLDSYSQNIWLLNIALGCKVFKNERGEIAFGINDAFNQNKNVQRNVSDIYYEDSRSNNLTRFFMLSFTYQIRNFNSGKRSTPNSFEDPGMRGPWGERRF